MNTSLSTQKKWEILILPFCSFLFLLVALGPCSSVYSQGVFLDEDGEFNKQVLKIPYGFWNEKFGFSAGYVYGVTGYPQKQSALIGTGMVGSEGSAAFYLLARDVQLPSTERWFLDAIASISYLAESDVYLDGNPEYPDVRAGSNDSEFEDFVQGEGWDNLFNLRFNYLLPFGEGKHTVIDTYRIDRGMLVAADENESSWNPSKTGKTYVEVVPFYRFQQITGDDIDDTDIKTNGFELALYWDDRDFFANPSSGHSLLVRLSNDFGWFDSNESWSSIEFELDKYFSLGTSENFRQRVVAFDFWTSYSPTWEEDQEGEITNRPPPYAGSTLGGLFRMRGYPAQRFNDKAAIYYGAELRMIPYWNPFDRWPWLQKYVGVEWLQLVPFVEIGRVAPSWQLEELHSDLKVDAGFGLRLWAKGLVVRVDTAVSEEDFGIQMMVNHPFQF